MTKFDEDMGNMYQLMNSMKEISGSSIYYKDTEGIVLWHNNNVIHDLKLNQYNIIG